MTSFNEGSINRAANGTFAAKTTSETRIASLVTQRRSAKIARDLHAAYDDEATFPHESFDRYMDAHSDDDQETSDTRARDYINGYAGVGRESESESGDTAWNAGARDAQDAQYYSPRRVDAQDCSETMIAASQRANEKDAQTFLGRPDSIDYDQAESDPDVADARSRFEHVRDHYEGLPVPHFADDDAEDQMRWKHAEMVDAFSRYESRRITTALNR